MRFVQAVLAWVGSLAGLLLALPVVLLALPLWAVSAATRAGAGLIRALRPSAVPWQELMRYEPVIGWKPRSGLDAHGRADDTFHVTTDVEGWRGRETVEAADVVVFGDSFAFGHGVDDDAFFADRAPGVRVKAIGANGYSMVQGLLLMEGYAPRLAGKTVVWFVYYGNDLFENLKPNLGRYRMPFVRERDGGWEVVTSHVSAEPWPFEHARTYYDQLAALCSPTRLSERVFGACDHLIGRARNLLEEAGARLVVVGIPDITQLDEAGRRTLRRRAPDPEAVDAGRPDRELEEICRRHGLEFVPLSRHLDRSEYKADDCHWTPSGHRGVAELLAMLHGRGGNRKAASPATSSGEEAPSPGRGALAASGGRAG